MKLSLF